MTSEVLYIGKAKDLRKRLYSWTALKYGTAFNKWREITKKHLAIGLLAFKSNNNFLLEDYLIKKYKPLFNARVEL